MIVPDVASEFENARFGDLRLVRRAQVFARAAADSPSSGLPRIAGSASELEAIYRWLGNEHVTPARILAPHMAATVARADRDDVIVAHDTTELKYGGAKRREGLGRIRNVGGSQGFFAHYSLAVARDRSRPLGVLGLKTWVRPWEKPKQGKSYEKSESSKWAELALDIHKSLPQAVHVMDREADSYALFGPLIEAGARFVIRLCRDKKLFSQAGKLFAAAGRAPIVAERSVRLSRRARNRCTHLAKLHPPREERVARLVVRAQPFEVARPKRKELNALPPSLRLNVVLVEEIEAPAADEPVSWLLITSEPVATAGEVEAVIDAYRARWNIEDFFKALKTGCSFEKRQLETFKTLVNALAVFSVIAWRLLLLRYVARHEPDAPAAEALTAQQVEVLQTLARMPDAPVRVEIPPQRPTAIDALRAVAALGGHLRRNGDPGWLVLGRGFDSLLLIELGWRARDGRSSPKRPPRCDR